MEIFERIFYILYRETGSSFIALSLQAIFYGFLNPVEFYIWLFSNNNVIDLL